MASLPKKGMKGADFKKWAVETLNALIDYLHGARIRPGYGISVRETPSGTIVELAKKEAPVINNTTGGTGVAQDISATVSGGTATIALSGSTSSVELVGTGGVTISGNTNGQIEINGSTSGGAGSVGFPNYSSVVWSIDSDHVSPSLPASLQFAYPVWIVGAAQVQDGQEIEVVFTGASVTHVLASGFFEDSVTDEVTIPSAIPVPANVPFTLQVNPDFQAPAGFKFRIFSCVS